MSQSSGIRQIVASYNLNLGISKSNAENLAANAAKTIDTYFCHNKFLLSFDEFLYKLHLRAD